MRSSFLFFYSIVLFVLSLWSNRLYSQQAIDSIMYYRQVVEDSKDGEELLSAYRFFREGNKAYLDVSHHLGVVHNLTQLAIIELKFGNLDLSEKTAVDALMLLETLDPNDPYVKLYATSLYNHFGKVYTQLEDYDSALKYFDKLITTTESPLSLNIIQNNKTYVYYLQKRYAFALNEFEIIYRQSVQLQDTIHIARVLDNIGQSQSRLGHHDAFKNLNEALSLRLNQGNIEGVVSSYLNLSEYLERNGNRDDALDYATKAYNFATTNKNNRLKFSAIEALLRLEDTSFASEYVRMNDSTNSAKSKSDNKFAKLKYDKTEQEKVALESERKTQLYQLIAVLVLLASIFIYFVIRSRNKRQQLKKVHDTEIRISKRIHDELGNDIYYLMTQIQGDTKSLLENDGLKVLDGLNEIYDKARDISREYTNIDTGEGYNEELLALLNSYGGDQTKIVTTKIEPDFWQPISSHKKTELFRVLQELLTNMKKHSKASLAAVTFSKKRNRIIVSYVDNGIGIRESELKYKNGLKNVETRMDSINGTITFETEKNRGLKAKIKFTA